MIIAILIGRGGRLLMVKAEQGSVVIKKVETKNILTKSNLPVGDYSLNPYIGCTHACKYCYANFMKRFTNHQEDWGAFLDVKYWPMVKNVEKYRGKSVFLSSVCDPYIPEEEEYQRTRTFLEEFKGSGIKLSIQTKSDLVLRDLDLIKTYPDVRVGFSINTLDEMFKDDMDRGVSIERRLAAMKKLHEEGICTTCFISPIFPGITDVETIIDAVKDQCNFIWLENLNLRGTFKPVIMNYIKENYPSKLALYQDIYQHGNRDFWSKLDQKVKAYADKLNLEYVYNDDRMQYAYDAKPVIVNYFYHEEIKKSAQRAGKHQIKE